MLQDLHLHTYYSFCGKDRPEEVVEAAIAGGLEMIGITDHNHGVGNARIDVFFSHSDEIKNDYGRNLKRYFDHINLIKEKYADKICVLRGIELTIPDMNGQRTGLPDSADVSFFDYCLIENPNLFPEKDLVALAKRCGCPMVGIAHTDLFAYMDMIGAEPRAYLARLAENHIFWEMNVSYDSIHSYREHAYMLRFFEDERQQKLVRESGMRLSVGFDGHRVEDYLPERIKDYCRKITEMGIKLAFEE